MKQYDVAVIGSGPSGASAAIHLAQQGLKVCLLEKYKLPREKVCAGGLVARAVAQLPDDLVYPYQAVCHQFETRIVGTDIHLVDRRPQLITMVDRHHFDNALVEHAVKLGATLFDATGVSELTTGPDGVEILNNNETLCARYVVLACGAACKLATQFWPALKTIPVLEVDVYPPQDVLDTYKNRAVFDLEQIKEGYGWVFYKGDHLSVGLGSYGPNKLKLREALKSYLSALNLEHNSEIKNWRGFVVPHQVRDGLLMKQRILLVGDTAGFADPITAEGLTFAITSGKLAAKAIVDGRDDPEAVSRHYHALLKEPILDELAAAQKLTKLIYRMPRFRNWLMRHFGQYFQRGAGSVLAGNRRFAPYASPWFLSRKIMFLFLSGK